MALTSSVTTLFGKTYLWVRFDEQWRLIPWIPTDVELPSGWEDATPEAIMADLRKAVQP